MRDVAGLSNFVMCARTATVRTYGFIASQSTIPRQYSTTGRFIRPPEVEEHVEADPNFVNTYYCCTKIPAKTNMY